MVNLHKILIPRKLDNKPKPGIGFGAPKSASMPKKTSAPPRTGSLQPKETTASLGKSINIINEKTEESSLGRDHI